MPLTVVLSAGRLEAVGGTLSASATALAASAMAHDTYLRTTTDDDVALTIDGDASRAIGWVLTVEQAGSGAVTFAAASGVTINCAAAQAMQTNGQYAVAQIRKVADGVYTLYGNLAAAS